MYWKGITFPPSPKTLEQEYTQQTKFLRILVGAGNSWGELQSSYHGCASSQDHLAGHFVIQNAGLGGPSLA